MKKAIVIGTAQLRKCDGSDLEFGVVAGVSPVLRAELVDAKPDDGIKCALALQKT